MSDRLKGVELLKKDAGGDRMVEGWVEGPCAMGADLRGINVLMTDFCDDPEFVRDLFAFSVEMELRFARAQVEAGADIVDLDSPSPLEDGRREMGPGQVLLGNLDPVRAVRNGTPESIAAALAECHRRAGPRYIVAAGCEIVRDTPEASLRVLAEYARGHRP